jgi:hypothetical protein
MGISGVGEARGTVLSLGMGVQSTALYLMSALGELPRIDYAVFSDTGREKSGTLRYLEWLLKWRAEHDGPEILVKTEKNLFQDLLRKTTEVSKPFASIPAFTMGDDGKEGLLRRQCTGEYKIAVVDRAIREVNGLKPRQRNLPTNIWKGISAEEAIRMSVPEMGWKNFIYPFVGYEIPGKGKWMKLQGELYLPMTRGDIVTWYRKNDLPIPPKSSCVFCPYHSDSTWADMQANAPDDFADAVKIDKAIRDSSKSGVERPIYLHRSLKPLDEVNFDPHSKIEFGDCSGTCNT